MKREASTGKHEARSGKPARSPLPTPRSSLCQRCQQAPIEGILTRRHWNARYCAACRTAMRHRPRSTVTPAQGQIIAQLIGTLSRTTIAQQLGVSRAAVNRYCRDHGLYGRSDAYPPAIVEAVCRAYAEGGRTLAQQRYPEVKVRCIIERYYRRQGYAPRQERWTEIQLIEAIRMAGLVSHSAQARYFRRPNASDGAIRKLWADRFRLDPRHLHGIPAWMAGHLAQPGCPATLVKHHQTSDLWPKILWLDLARHLRPDVPPWQRAIIDALAGFQAWLWGTTDPAHIRAVIQAREAISHDERTVQRPSAGRAQHHAAGHTR